jgi:hypothetical protein
MIELYQKVLLNRNFPEYDLKKGDVAILVDTVPIFGSRRKAYIILFSFFRLPLNLFLFFY